MDPSPAWGIAVVWGGHPLPRTPLLCHSQSCGSQAHPMGYILGLIYPSLP